MCFRAVEEIEGPLDRLRIGLRAREPLVPLAAVVERQVANDPQAAGVGSALERRERLVAAEERIYLVERGRVVAVGALSGKEGRQVDRVGTEGVDPVEMLLDARQVAAEDLAVDVARTHLRFASQSRRSAQAGVAVGRPRPRSDR